MGTNCSYWSPLSTIYLSTCNQLINFTKTRFDYLKDLQLADSSSTDEIDLLIGSSFYWSVVTGKTKTGKNNEPVAVEPKFGWVSNGPVTSWSIYKFNIWKWVFACFILEHWPVCKKWKHWFQRESFLGFRNNRYTWKRRLEFARFSRFCLFQ